MFRHANSRTGRHTLCRRTNPSVQISSARREIFIENRNVNNRVVEKIEHFLYLLYLFRILHFFRSLGSSVDKEARLLVARYKDPIKGPNPGIDESFIFPKTNCPVVSSSQPPT